MFPYNFRIHSRQLLDTSQTTSRQFRVQPTAALRCIRAVNRPVRASTTTAIATRPGPVTKIGVVARSTQLVCFLSRQHLDNFQTTIRQPRCTHTTHESTLGNFYTLSGQHQGTSTCAPSPSPDTTDRHRPHATIAPMRQLP